MKKEKKNISRIIYIILLSFIISGILHFLYNANFTDMYILDGCSWGEAGAISSLGCTMNSYFQPVGQLLAAILSMFIATIISYKLICNKKIILTQKDKKNIYITLEILLIYKWIMNLPMTIIEPYYFIEMTQKTGVIAIILPIVSSIGLFIITSWLLNKIVYQKRLLRNKNIMIFPLILGMILLSVSLYIMYSNRVKDYNKEYNEYIQKYPEK